MAAASSFEVQSINSVTPAPPSDRALGLRPQAPPGLGLRLRSLARRPVLWTGLIHGRRGACRDGVMVRPLPRRGSGRRSRIASNNDRLAPLRAVEDRIFGDVALEVTMLTDAFNLEDIKSLTSLVRSYHRRRKRKASRYVQVLKGEFARI